MQSARRSRMLIIAGIVIIVAGLLLFVGLRIFMKHSDDLMKESQEKLRAQWNEKPLTITGNRDYVVAAGAPVGQITIPRIGLSAIIVELANVDDRHNLNRGPGHIPGTAYPGMSGNCVIAGHRTTYGAPFGRIDELVEGDEVILETGETRHIYVFSETVVVEPSDMSVLDQGDPDRVTLVACHPKFTSKNRIVVSATLQRSEPLSTGGRIW